MFGSKPKSDPFERERILLLTQIADLRSELSKKDEELLNVREQAKEERQDLLERIIAIGYPKLSQPRQARKTPSSPKIPLHPGFRPDLRPPDPLETEITPEFISPEHEAMNKALDKFLNPPFIATTESESAPSE